jgi:hypothetical protein
MQRLRDDGTVQDIARPRVHPDPTRSGGVWGNLPSALISGRYRLDLTYDGLPLKACEFVLLPRPAPASFAAEPARADDLTIPSSWQTLGNSRPADDNLGSPSPAWPRW